MWEVYKLSWSHLQIGGLMVALVAEWTTLEVITGLG